MPLARERCAGTAGALLVIVSSALMVFAAAALLLFPGMARGLRGTLVALIFLDIAGTGFAAYMLEATWLIAAMALALVGWIIRLTTARPARRMSGSAAVLSVCSMAGLLVLLFGSALAQSPSDSPASTREKPAVGTTHYEGWYTFNGDLENRKFSEADQITPQNVAGLQKAWEVHTGDMSDGSGSIPVSDWSATPLFVNGTVYVSTPFYRVFAIAPDTGKVKWTYDTHAVLEAVTQPDLKSRGVAYWQAAAPQAGTPCERIVYVGTMDAKLHAVDADSGRKCEGFADNGVLDLNQWNTKNAKWPLSALQPPTVYKDTLFIGWAGKDWGYSVELPGTVFAVDAQSGRLKWTFNAIPPEMRQDRHLECLGRHVGRPGARHSLSAGQFAQSEYLWRRPEGGHPAGDVDHGP